MHYHSLIFKQEVPCFISQGSSQLTVLLPVLEGQSFFCACSQTCPHSSTPPWLYLVCCVKLPCLIITAPTITFLLPISYEAPEIYFLIHTVIYCKISELQRQSAWQSNMMSQQNPLLLTLYCWMGISNYGKWNPGLKWKMLNSQGSVSRAACIAISRQHR